MNAKQIIVVIVIVLVTSTLSALVAYRTALRRMPPVFTKVNPPVDVKPQTSTGCVDFHDAASHVGQTGCISGRLLRVFTSRGGNSFLDFCESYKDCPFTSVIFAADKNKFGDMETLNGRQIEIQGNITSYQGRAEIIVHSPQQIHELP
ncbi:MAG TPA: hypothetical protein VKV95_23935 [Terriglobia bacterium]|nr:hypothetical protein [Terriglobia bacterium]